MIKLADAVELLGKVAGMTVPPLIPPIKKTPKPKPFTWGTARPAPLDGVLPIERTYEQFMDRMSPRGTPAETTLDTMNAVYNQNHRLAMKLKDMRMNPVQRAIKFWFGR